MAYHRAIVCASRQVSAPKNPCRGLLGEVRSFSSPDGSSDKRGALFKSDLVTLVAEQHDLTNAKAGRIVDSIFDAMHDVSICWINSRSCVLLKGLSRFTQSYSHLVGNFPQKLAKRGRVGIHEFGSFSTTKRAARNQFSVHAQKMMFVPEKWSPKFTASKSLKEAVKKSL
jgi:nucleoid DNA-binding protein